ncbi:Xanthine/uracil permease [Thermanaeromonas toyohensis ToBE]|uniref:Xanthine/uracil permease n=1 Tax=Thermanaeromonas toyohensis ToBE TaxID=698762 RepID=A0A1W1VB07_9FIRM|nr:purine/pyrimidine permease [Thermanaeromonas toyohensis]SMB90599.1 Xanthine/uracil permease [Thermanaeromonas toyohensis ToBE]
MQIDIVSLMGRQDTLQGKSGLWLYALQWVVFHLGVIISVPVIAGSALGMSAWEIARLSQITFFLTGLASLIQVKFGHGVLLVEGPAAPWWAAYILLASMAAGTGKSLVQVRTNIEGAMIVVGVILAIMAWARLITRWRSLFTPRITGVLLTVLGLQIGGVGVKGIISGGIKLFGIGLLVLIMVVYLTLNGRGMLKQGAIVVGVAFGWVLSLVTGSSSFPRIKDVGLISLPSLFPWGRPTFDFGTLFSLSLLGILLIPNVIGSISAWEAATGDRLSANKYDRGLAASGVVNIMSGLGGGVGTIPFAISAGLISVTGNASSPPFILACLMFIAMGLFPPLGRLIGSIPQPVVAAVLLVSGSSLAVIGLKDMLREEIAIRESYIIGLSLLLGIGVMLLPSSYWAKVPAWAAGALSNGVIVGTLTSILLEHVILRRKRQHQLTQKKG